MPTQELKNKTVAGQTDLDAWLPPIIPVLKTCWAKQVTGLLAETTPKLSDWLALLHTAAVAPKKIPHHVAQLLNMPPGNINQPSTWVALTKLFSLTSQALQDADRPDSNASQSLLEIQNRILQAVASGASIQTGPIPLNHQTAYRQTLTALNKKLAVVKGPHELFNNVVALLQQNFGYDYVHLFSLNQAKQILVLESAIWKNEHPHFEDLVSLDLKGPSITAKAASTGWPVLINNIADDAKATPHPELPNLKSQLSIPLLAGNNLAGVLDIASDQGDAFSQDDMEILQVLANHIALAIENSQLQKTLQQRVHEQKLLYESNMALGTSLDLETVLKLMTQKMAEVMVAGACTICKIDKNGNTITNIAEYVLRYPGNPSRTWRKVKDTIHIAKKDPIAQKVLKTGRPVIAWAESEKPAVWHQPDKANKNEASWGTVLALPLETEKRITGLIEIYDKNPHRNFSADDIQLCQILTTQTTLAMERAQLFEETRRRLSEVSTLYTMAQDITSTLDLQGILDSIVISLRHVIGCRGCCIFLLDPVEQKLEIKAADGLKPQWKEMAKLDIGEGAAGKAVEQKQTIYISDTRDDPDFIFFDEDVRSLMVIPLMSQGEIIGAINLDDSKPNAFGGSQEQLLTIAAAQAGIAIENARLFARVAAEQQQTQAIIQYMADGLLLIDDHGTIVTCNTALSMMLGMHPGQIVGQKIDSPNLHPHLVSITGTTTQHARTGVLAKEVTIQTPRSRTLQIFSTVMVGDNKKPIGEVRVVHDVTKERELEQLKEDFMSTISHELRTPLFSIQGFVQILMEEDELEEGTRQEFLTIIQTQTVQLSEMVNNLLDASKFDEGKLKFEKHPVAILDLIQQTSLRLRGFAHQQKVELVTELPSTLPHIIGDKERLEQVLTNLIGNAIKFTPEAGQVTVIATTSENEILIEVKDTGIGISPHVQEQIFSRYYQVEEKSEGTKRGSGLGLYIAKQIVKGHEGHIWVESKGIPGEGSTFRFTLPLPNPPIEM